MAVSPDVLQMVVDALQTHGFVVERVRGNLIKGSWNGDDAVILVYDGGEKFSEVQPLVETDARWKAVACFLPLPERYMRVLYGCGVRIWERNEVERIVGAHFLAERGGVRLRYTLFPEKKDEGGVVVDLPDVHLIQGKDTIRPVFTDEDVKSVKEDIAPYVAELEWRPAYLFRYTCMLARQEDEQGKNGAGPLTQKKGMVWVDAVDGKTMRARGTIETWEGEIVHSVEPVLSPEEAEAAAIKGVQTINTHEREEVKHTGTATVFEKVTIAPVPGSVSVENLGLFYIPIWRVEGEEGVVWMNGITGEVLREKTLGKKDERPESGAEL